MRSIIVKLIVFLIVLVGLAYGGYYLWQNRDAYFFKGGDEQIVKDDVNKVVNDDVAADNQGDIDDDEGDEDDDENDNEDKNKLNDDGEYFIPVIHKSDCDDECVGRKSVDIEYKYCREICGFNEIKDKPAPVTIDEEEDCDDIDDSFEEDVCWKEKAIKEKNDKYCDEIYSEALGKVCHNRVLEEIMN